MNKKEAFEVVKMDENFKEIQSVEEANKMDLKVWCFLKFSEYKGYIFKKRSPKK